MFLFSSLPELGINKIVDTIRVGLNIESFNRHEEVLEELERNEITEK